METDKMSTASSVGAAERRPLLAALIIERRILFGCTIVVGLSTFIWITAVCTQKWVHIEGGNGIYLPLTGRIFLSSDSGVWETCRYVMQPPAQPSPASNSTAKLGDGQILTKCTNYLSAQGPITKIDPAYNFDVANYVRTMISFGIISIFVMTMGCGFSLYTFKNPRYMFKRLAAGIHFISTSCTFVVVQVTMSNVDYIKKNVKFVYPDGAYHYYHFSFWLACFVVMVNLFAAAAFLWFSKKRKGDKAATEELGMADEPTIIGR